MKILSFASYLTKNYQVFAPQEENGQILIKELKDPKGAVLDSRPPFYSWKKFFVPEGECLFEYSNSSVTPPLSSPPYKGGDGGVVLFGLNILDLKSVLLYDQVFSNDPYYQERRKNLLIVAHNLVPDAENNLAGVQYDQEKLKHLPFDIFLELSTLRGQAPLGGLTPTKKNKLLASQNNKKKNIIKIFTGSTKGKEILEKFGYKDFEHIEFESPLREDASGSKMNAFRDKLKNHHNPKIWEELGKICLDCGKCAIICPTCFCFRIDDQPELQKNSGVRNRCWDSCFYEEFSEVTGGPARNATRQQLRSYGRVAGGYKFLKTTADRIHFWYYHKFARIPDEFGITGCVGCHRCHDVCPVGIDIKEVAEKIGES